MKVKPAVKPPQMQKVSFSLPASTVNLLAAYGKAYSSEYGEDPDEDYLVNAIITDYLESDKEFKKFLEQNPDLVAEGAVKKTRKRRAGAGTQEPAAS